MQVSALVEFGVEPLTRNRTGDSILTMEPPGTAVRTAVSQVAPTVGAEVIGSLLAKYVLYKKCAAPEPALHADLRLSRKDRSMRVAVIGAGAIGSVIGGLLARAHEDVTLIGRRPHVDAVNRNGLRIDGALGTMQVRVRAADGSTSGLTWHCSP